MQDTIEGLRDQCGYIEGEQIAQLDLAKQMVRIPDVVPVLNNVRGYWKTTILMQ
jgi:hypothetical protein